jgi:hypothetical protein
MRRAMLFAAAVAGLFAAGCVRRVPLAEPLAAISPLPEPTRPPLIVALQPVGDTDTLAQVQVRFSDDLIPLERLESPDEAALLAHFSLDPALPGRFRFLTPRMIGFEADRAWPSATRVRVRIAKGLHGLHGRALDTDIVWTFQTPPIALTDLPTADEPADLAPKIRLTSNVALDRASLAAHAFLRPKDTPRDAIPLVVPPDTATASPTATDDESAFDSSDQSWHYLLIPVSTLAKGANYDVVFEPGILPRDGNLASDATFTGALQAHDTLRSTGINWSAPGRFAQGDVQLTFTTPIDPASLGALSLAPAPPRGTTPFAVFDTSVGVNSSLLAPNTSYTVALGAGLRDTFGQTLGTAQQRTFRTGDLAADVWAPSGASLFPAGKDVRLNVVAVNAPSARATFVPLKAADVVRYPDPAGEPDRGDVLPPSAAWPRLDTSAAHNVERTIEVPLRAKLDAPAGVLAYGVAATFGPDRSFVAAGVVQLTDLGVFAQFFPDGGSVRVNRIADGTPVAAATVEVYPSQTDLATKTTPRACATATTDDGGVATFGGSGFAACAARDGGENDAPSFVTIVRRAGDWTYVRSDPYSGAFSGDFWNGWSSATPIAYGTIFSDRQLYQPGETANLTAVGWFLVDGVLRRGRAPSYTMQLELPDGTKQQLGQRSLDAFGMTSLAVSLPPSAPLGYYLLRATAGNGEQLTGDFRVAQFKPPNFKVDLGLDRAVAQRGTSVNGVATNAYLFGAPLAGATTKFTVTRSQADFAPKGREEYSFGRHWYWPDQPPDAATDVLQTTVTADATGKSAVAVPVATELPYPMTYAVDAETTDASNTAVSDTKTFTALPSQTLVGVMADDIGTAGTPLAVAVIATDAAGATRSATKVKIELQAAKYATATQIVEGAEQATQSVSYATVASAEVTTGDTPVNVTLTPLTAGEYRLRANLAGATDDAAETDRELFVGGSGSGAWFARDPNLISVKLDRASYRPGDRATVLVQSPFPRAQVQIAVVRHGLLWQTTLTTASAAPTASFRVTPEMLPNAVVEAFVVRRGAPPATAPADGGNVLARTGFAPFTVALDAKYVTATVRADAAVLAPGAKQTVRFSLSDAAHHPVRGEAALMVVNDAVLQLTGYRPPDMVKLVYAEQPISLRYADNRGALALTTPTRPLEKGWGFGGGLSSGDADPRVRRAFSALAYFAGAVRTDAQGNASATFTLPDDLTTWRVMVVSTTADGRFGNGETTFHTTKPLVANPVLPQFARPGDQFEGGVAVTNGTAAAGQLRIDAAFAGPLAFLNDGRQVPSTTFGGPLEKITTAYRFPIVATGAGVATATIRVRSAGAGDAFAIPLPVRDLDVMEAVAQTGTTGTQATVPLDIAAGTPRDAGGLDIALASSLIPEITVAAQDALRGDERLTFLAAARLTVASDLALLAARTNSAASAARTRAATEIANLSALRRGDGGFAPYWQATRSDPWDSMVALKALSRARQAAIPFDARLLAGAATYAAAVLADPTAHAAWCKTDLCKAELRLSALDALAEAGDRRTTFLNDIDAQRTQFGFADRARLARLLSLAPGYDARAATLAKTVEDELSQSAFGAAVNLPGRYRWNDDRVVAQAEALRLELARNADGETLDRLTRSLLDMRRNGSFGCACENAAALDALVALSSHEAPANFTATATLRGRTLANERFSGARAPQRTATVAMPALPLGRSDLALAKSGTGTLHFAVTYRYRVAGAAPGVLNGLRITRIVRLANAPAILATLGLGLPAAALTLPVAQVYDVELEIISDHPVERVVISDPLPAGMEAVDTSFATTSSALTTPATSWQIGDQQIRPDRIDAYADQLDAGIYRLHYLARTVTPGTFVWPGAGAHIADRPDEFGRSAASIVVVK